MWLVGIDPVTTNCKELAEILQGFEYFSKLPIHFKIQQLLIKKTNTRLEWNDIRCVKVVTIQCARHLHKVTVKALRKTCNSVKPKDVENRPNGTNAKMVEWYGDRNSPNRTQEEFGVATTAKGKHVQWL